ncbi:MAG: ATP-dependent Clp protease proteolytic subunit [Nitriliruptoraceae bacterium]
MLARAATSAAPPSARQRRQRTGEGPTVAEDFEKLLGGSRRAFDTLFDSRILFLKGPLEDDVADTLVAQLLALDAENDEDITLYINSPGGIITGMFAIYDAMRLLRSKVDVRCLGLAASAGAFLLATGTGTRSATENARIMIHQPLGGARGTAKDIEIQAKNIVWIRERINEILAERTGQDLATIQKDTDRDKWMTAAEALEYGLIDEVVEPGRGS